MILIDKPAGLTSFGVVARVRRVLSKREGKKVKVGHTGTLDPFATGLLILMAGKDTRKCQEFLKLDKEYLATFCLGKVSTTGDPEGEITVREEERVPSEEEVRAVLAGLTGKIVQKVPAYSAVKVGGRRAYELARRGQEVETPSREVEIYELELLDYEYPEVRVRAKVSSGTYIRTLGEDIGERLQTGAYTMQLRRTQVGEYRVEEAEELEEWMRRNDG